MFSSNLFLHSIKIPLLRNLILHDKRKRTFLQESIEGEKEKKTEGENRKKIGNFYQKVQYEEIEMTHSQKVVDSNLQWKDNFSNK